MNAWNTVIILVVFAICLTCFVYMHFLNNKFNVNRIIDEAAHRSGFNPTQFQIYDKSTKEMCDRLIVVAPFDWYIWAVRGELYILNPEGGIRCAANTTPGIRVFADQFVETCLKLDFMSIMDLYVEGHIPKIVPYDIPEDATSFTILTALNLLVKDWITFDIEQDARITIYHLPSKDNEVLGVFDENKRKKRSVVDIEGRELSPQNVITVTQQTPHDISHAELHRSYLEHAAPSLYTYKELPEQNHPSFITARQHLEPNKAMKLLA